MREVTIIANVKIAVIDEDVVVRDFVVSTLMYSVNRDVQAFDNGFDAWIYFEESGFPDMVVADVNLREIDGLTLTSKIKQIQPKTIVALFSEMPQKEKAAKEHGADVFMAKPFGVNELFNLIQTYVVESEPNQEGETESS